MLPVVIQEDVFPAWESRCTTPFCKTIIKTIVFKINFCLIGIIETSLFMLPPSFVIIDVLQNTVMNNKYIAVL